MFRYTIMAGRWRHAGASAGMVQVRDNSDAAVPNRLHDSGLVARGLDDAVSSRSHGDVIHTASFLSAAG